ncbi:MAG: hypothetical protein WD011_06830, partial [Nitriliruptoraceae bacterium]
DIDVQGALQVRDALTDRLLIFLAPPSMDELERRLRQRGTEDDVAIARRLDQATAELKLRDEFDVIVVNDDLERCVDVVSHAVSQWRQHHADGDPSTAVD